MRKMIMVLMMVFTMIAGLFADIKLLPKDMLNSYGFTCEGEPVQLQIGYVVDSWEDVYKKTGIGMFGWKEKDSSYSDVIRQCFVIMKCQTPDGHLCWICYEYPGDGSQTFYVADI